MPYIYIHEQEFLVQKSIVCVLKRKKQTSQVFLTLNTSVITVSVCVCVCVRVFVCLQSSHTTRVTQTKPYTPQPHQDPDYRTGSCDFSNVALSAGEGDYYYKAVIVPGNVHKVFGPVTVCE